MTDRLTALLTDPITGLVHEQLRPVFDELNAAPRPQSVITWLKKPPATGARLLGQMARRQTPISHDTFRNLPADRSHNYLRELLASTGTLPRYHAPIEQMERWLDDKLELVDTEDAAVIGRYGRWHLLRNLRTTADRGGLSTSAIYGARSHINGAIRLSRWATTRRTTIAGLTQSQLEAYLAEHPGGRNAQQGFVIWLGRSRTNTAITMRWRESTLPEVVVADVDRWEQIDQLLHDEQIALYARIGGLFTLLFAQPLEAIVSMRTDQVAIDDAGRVMVSFEAVPVEMPPALDDLIRRHLTRPGAPSIASTDHGWLFPGRHPGRHMVRENFRSKLVANGIHPGQSRQAAMFALAGGIPAAVLSDLIGIADTTAIRWAALAARDWSGYIAQRQL
ncbi:hypothetical protein [Cryobacterium sp. Y62]|uniref:hypothetical protein n=1 Tax=Cryobacterium sp. Y62 TaxID=2048284 RepID=UPI0011AFE483|nr:hypothetical protein [Cryobacterium sp. Y62]